MPLHFTLPIIDYITENTNSIFVTYTIKNSIKFLAIFSFSFLCLLLFGVVKLAFAVVLVGIGSAISVLIAYLQILYAFEEVEASVLFFYLVGLFVYPTALILIYFDFLLVSSDQMHVLP